MTFVENECKTALLNCFDVVASLAQWQSTGLVNQGSRVQIPHEAVLFGLVVCLITFDASERNLAVNRDAKTSFPVLFRAICCSTVRVGEICAGVTKTSRGREHRYSPQIRVAIVQMMKAGGTQSFGKLA